MTYVKKLAGMIGKAAMGGMQTAMFLAAAGMFGGLLLVVIGKPIYLVLRWLWSVYIP
jgi:hypothetical protein